LYAEGSLDLDAGQKEKLVLACRTHTDGATSSDATVGVCFDADRLDLVRVGIEPDAELMSTDAGRKTRVQVVLAAARQEHRSIDESSLKQLSMLRILHASCATALDAFRATDSPVDTQLVVDLEKMVERTRVELERLVTRC
jgi:hypothetical protein